MRQKFLIKVMIDLTRVLPSARGGTDIFLSFSLRVKYRYFVQTSIAAVLESFQCSAVCENQNTAQHSKVDSAQLLLVLLAKLIAKTRAYYTV